MQKILVATDFSERSDRAIRRATLLAKNFGGFLFLVHVVDDDQPRRLIKTKQQLAMDVLVEQSVSIREVDGVECDFIVALGDPFVGIRRVAEDVEADLIVIGPHRRQALKDIFVGTTAERTIRESQIPVLMANGVPSGHYHHALLAVDLSDCSADAVLAVKRLGIDKKVVVSVVHVFDAPASGMMRRASSNDQQIEDYTADEEEYASVELKEFLERADFAPAEEILTPAEGSYANTICAVAQKRATDIIIVATHGRRGVSEFFLGSVTEEVFRTTKHDVLAVPPRSA